MRPPVRKNTFRVANHTDPHLRQFCICERTRYFTEKMPVSSRVDACCMASTRREAQSDSGFVLYGEARIRSQQFAPVAESKVPRYAGHFRIPVTGFVQYEAYPGGMGTLSIH